MKYKFIGTEQDLIDDGFVIKVYPETSRKECIFILNTETNEISCKDCGVVFIELTTKEKLEQLGWFDEGNFMWKRIDNIELSATSKEFHIDCLGGFDSLELDLTELQLILDYIKEQENDK